MNGITVLIHYRRNFFLFGFLLKDSHSRDTPPPPVDDDDSFIEDMILLDILNNDDNW
jgi:hypothetical protein